MASPLARFQLRIASSCFRPWHESNLVATGPDCTRGGAPTSASFRFGFDRAHGEGVRGQRDFYTSEFFHLGTRGADRCDVFGIETDWIFFEERLSALVERYDVVVHAFAWMTNHVHLLVRSRDRQVPAMMRDLLSSHALSFNRRTARSGPLFDARYFCVPIIGDRHFVTTARYIHRNPIPIVGTRRLHRFRWSSLPAYLELAAPRTWLTTDPLAGMIDPERYRERVVTPIPTDRLPFNDLPPQIETSLDEVLTAAAQVCRSATTVERKVLTATLAFETRAADVVEIATSLGITPSSAREYGRRGRRRLERDPDFGELFDRSVRSLTRVSPAA